MLSRLLVHIACALFPGNNVSLPLSKATPAVSLAEALQVLQHLIQSRKNAGAEAISPVSSVDFDSDDSESLRQPPSSPMGSKRLFLVLDDFDYVCSQPGTETPKPNSRMIPLIKRVWDLLIGSGVFHGVVLSCSTPSFLEFLRDKQTHPSSVVRVALPRPSEGEVFSVVTTLMERNCSYLYCEDDSTSTLSWPPQQLDSSAISGITRAVVRSQLPIPLLHVLCALAATFPPLTRSRAKAIADANADLQATFSLLLDRVVQVIGKEAQMFLGLLSVSRNGLSEDEIVYALYELREATIAVGVPVAPPAVTALRDIFDEILVSSVDGRFQVLPAVRLAAMKRCVPSTEDRYLLHGGLADLFTRQCLRGDGRWRIDHPRAMRELSYHLCRSSRTGTKVLGRLLADPAFLFAKALACGMDALAEDFMDAGLTAESARTTDTVTRSVLRSAWMVLGGSASSAVRTFLPALSMALTLQLTDTKFTLPLRPHESQKMNDVIDAASEMSPLVSTCTVVGGSDMFRGLLQAVVALPISNLSHDQEQRCHVVGGFYDSKHQRSELHWLHGRLPGTCTPVKLNQWRNCSPWIDGRVRTMCLLWEQELLLCSSDSETRLFRLRDGFELLGPGSLPSLTSSCELRKGLFAGGDRNGLVSVWTMRCFTEATSPSKFRNSLMPARKGDVSTVRVTSSAALRLHDKPITSLVVLSEGLLLSGSKDRCVALWSVSQEGEGSAISAWRKHNAPITCLSAVTIQRSESSTLRFAVSGDESGCVRSWNLNSKQPQGYAQLQQPKYAGGQASISVTALFQPGTSLPLFGVGDSCCRIHLFDAIKGFFVATFDVNSMMEPPIGKLLPCGPTMIVGKRRLTSIGIGEVWLPTFQGNGILPPTAILGRKARPLPSLQPLPEDHAGATNSPRASTETDTAPHSPTSTKSQGPVRGVSTLRPTELASNRDLQPANVSLISMESDPTRVVEPIEPSSHYIESTTTDPIAVKPLVTDPQRRILDTRVPNQTRPDSKQSTPIRSSQPERTAVTGSDPMDGIRRLALEVRNHPPSASDEDLSTLLRLLKKVEREHGIMATRSPAGVTKLGGPSNTKTSGDLLEAKESACQEPDSYTMKNVSDTRPLPPNKLPEATVRRPTAVNAPDTAEEDLSVTLRQRTTIDYAEQAKNDEDVPASISEVPPVVDIEPKTIPRKHPNDNDMKASPIDIPPKSSDGLSTLEKQTSPTKSLKKDSSLVCTKKGDAVADVSEKLVSTSDMKSKSHGAGPTSPDRIGQLRARARAKVQSGLSLQRRDLSALWGNAFQLPTRTAERKVLAPTRGLPIRKDAGDVPGPGLYPVKSEFDQNLRRSRGFSFAKRSSSVERPRPAHRKDTPAPGSYNLPSSFEESLRHKKGFTMGRATERLTKRHNRAKDDSDLGPGVYGPGPSEFDRFVDPQRSRGFTIAPRRDRQPKKHGPDPGSYEVKGFADEAREKGRGFSFHSSEAQMTGSSSKYRSKSCPKARPGAKDDSHIPGPGAYWTDLRTSAPAFSFGRKFESRPDETPGPGYYDPQTEATIPKAPEYSVAQRIEEVIDPIPGPTHYNPEYSYVCSGAPSFSMGRRLEANLRQAPGPADYDTNVSMRMTLGAGPAYSIGLPFEPPTDNNPIGPGYYEHKGLAEDNAGKGFTMYARLEDPVSDSPGPGTYDSEQRTNAPSFSFGQKLYDPTNDLPGPGSYDVDGCFGVDSKGKTIGLPLSSSVEQTPGPGDYCYSGNDVSVEASRKDFTMGERIALKPIEGPGPGAYEHHYLMSESVGKGFTMYPKLSTPTSDVPGPGTYDSRGSFEGTRSITIGKRLSEVVQQTPAPGDYNTTSEFDSANKGVSIGLPLEHGVSETPGPGTYSIPSDLERSGKGVSFGIRLEDSVNDTPGPGTYDAEQESWAGPGKGVSIGLPLDSKPQDTPGPGAYSSDAQTVADEAQKKGKHHGVSY
eukprot:Rmarinus@m.20628